VAGPAGPVRELEDHRLWALDGTWQRIAERLRLDADLDEGPDWTLGVDTSVTRGGFT
jgi:hypothetical protein